MLHDLSFVMAPKEDKLRCLPLAFKSAFNISDAAFCFTLGIWQLDMIHNKVEAFKDKSAKGALLAMTQALPILSKETKVLAFRVFYELECLEQAVIWSRVANLITVVPKLTLSVLIQNDMWCSAFLEVDRVNTDEATSCFVKLMIETHRLQTLVSLPLKLSCKFLETVLKETGMEERRRKEVLGLMSIVVGRPDQFKGYNSLPVKASLPYDAVAEVYDRAQEGQAILPCPLSTSKPPLEYHVIRPRFSEPLPSKDDSSSSHSESFKEFHSKTLQPQLLSPISTSSIKPKRLNFLTSPPDNLRL
jgi:hypothetical protein